MPQEVSLIFPHQLFRQHPALDKGRPVHLVEESLFFRQYPFHKKKLVLHRASMKSFAAGLVQAGHDVHYIDAKDAESDVRVLLKGLAAKGVQVIHAVDPVDDWLRRRVEETCREKNLKVVLHDSPNFLNAPGDVEGFFRGRKSYFQTDFYVWQRKQRKVLLEADGKPLGGKWSFDTENRKKFPRGEQVPPLPPSEENKYLAEARSYVQSCFKDYPGSLDGPCLFAVTAEDAERWLDDFITQRLEKFGVYEDAIVAGESVLHHSLLTPMLNIGLLTPQRILDRILDASRQQGIPMNSVEGFVRQVIGWREFIRILYHREGRKQRTRNFFGFKRRIPRSFWTGDTGIAPVDITIRKVIDTGYCHHIERLMVLGNFMLLCEFDPDEVYRWFMELFIDAYDWVMVPNVYGMSQYADGGLMTTKPYISGSNYVMKMSDHQKGAWQHTWDGLFWRFLHVHREVFRGNPRWSMLLKTFDNMSADKQERHLSIAEKYLSSLSQP